MRTSYTNAEVLQIISALVMDRSRESATSSQWGAPWNSGVSVPDVILLCSCFKGVPPFNFFFKIVF